MANPWIESIDNSKIFIELTRSRDVTIPTRDAQCVLCKGSRMLCGKSRCPIIVKFYAHLKTKPLIDTLQLDGSSPPAVFVGRIGYPFVSIGPLIPPIHGDTTLLDTPELWLGKSIDDITNFRFQLVRGKYRVNAYGAEGVKIADLTRELALSNTPAEVDAEFLKKPSGRLILNDEVQPFGPSAPLKKMKVGDLKIDQRIEKAYSDTDLKATEAVLMLYRSGVLISKIQRAFSVGAFGVKNARRFVPTRWSLTAVDSIISKNLVNKVKTHPWINEYQVYEYINLDNRWVVLMIPGSWSYELIEAWYPQTVWNPEGTNIVMYSDSEGFWGRTTYAEIGGCYYSSRVSVSEALERERRQAVAVVLREVHPGYIMPVGVWNVRLSVREALKNPPLRFNTLQETLTYIASRLSIKMEKWIANSKLLKNILYQKKISDFIK